MDDDQKKKKKKLKHLKPKSYKIYGIFNFQTDVLVYVDLDFDKVMFEFDLAGYTSEAYDIVSFDVLLV